MVKAINLCSHFVTASAILSVTKGGMEESKAQEDRLQPFHSQHSSAARHKKWVSEREREDLLAARATARQNPLSALWMRHAKPLSALACGAFIALGFLHCHWLMGMRTLPSSLPRSLDAAEPISAPPPGLDPDHPPRPSFFPSSLYRILSFTKSTINRLRVLQSRVQQSIPSTARYSRSPVLTIVWIRTDSASHQNELAQSVEPQNTPRSLLIVGSLV